MPRSILLRSALAVALLGAFLPLAFSQSQDSPSVAEAARRARERKKDSAKPSKVITDDTLDVKKGDVQSAVAEEPKIKGASDAAGQSANAAASPAADEAKTQAAKDEKLKKEVAAAKEHLKDALGDLDLLERENRLDQDTYDSEPNASGDTAGKQKLDDQRQKISDKRQEIDHLKGKLADLQKSLAESSPASSQR